MTNEHKEVVLRFYERDAGMIEMDVSFPDDYDDKNPRGFELAGLLCLSTIQEAAEAFERVKEN